MKMNGKLMFAFLLTIATVFSKTLAIPVSDDFQTVNVGQLPYSSIFPSICLIPCMSTGTGKVCGNDGKTYADIGFIECRQACGENICKVHDGKCSNKKKWKKTVCE